jgi:hypothetical protein
MSENKNPKRRGITLKTPEDARRLIRRIVDKAFAEGSELEYSGRLAQLLGVWGKFWEQDKMESIEARLRELEKERK